MVHYVPPDTGRTHHTCDIAIPNDNLENHREDSLEEEGTEDRKLRKILKFSKDTECLGLRLQKWQQRKVFERHC